MCPLNINIAKTAYPANKQAKLIDNFRKFTIANGKSVYVNHGARTENVLNCTAGVLNADKKNFMFQANPAQEPIEFIKKELQKQVDILKETCEDVRAFICGGLELNTKDRESVKSFDLYNKIADTLDELGVKFTMMCGKKRDAMPDGIYAVNNNITLWGDASKSVFKQGNGENLGMDDIVNLLEDSYQFVEIAPDQKVKIAESLG